MLSHREVLTMRKTVNREHEASLSPLLADVGIFPDAGSVRRAPREEVQVSLMAAVKDLVKDLHPAYFALVMATGIISIAAHLLGMGQVAIALFWFNVIAFGIIWLLTISRVIWFPGVSSPT